MKRSLVGQLILITLVSTGMSVFAQGKKSAVKKEASKTEEAKSISHKVSGGLQWTGYGVGKSHTGDLKLKTGSITTVGDVLTGGEFVFDMNTISEANKRLEGHLKSADFFDVNKPGFETSKFLIKKVETLKGAKAGEPTHKISGELTIKGKTNPIDFSAIVSKDGTRWKATGNAEIKDRTQFDIVYNSKKFAPVAKLADKAIEDNITIKFDVVTE